MKTDMSKFIRAFKDKHKARAWIDRCRKLFPGANGSVYATAHGGGYHAYISGEFTEEEVMATCPKTIQFHSYKP